jgi:O-antigen ligase
MILSNLVRAGEVSPMLWLRMAVVGGVLFLSAYLAPSASILYVILPAGIVAVLVLIRNPELGLIALIVSALSVPFAIGTGTQTSLHAAILLIPLMVGVWVIEMVRQKSIRLVPSSVNLPILLFALSALLSFLAGNLPWNYFAGRASLQSQSGGLAVFVFSAAIFLWVGNQIKDVFWLKVITIILLVVGAVAVVGKAFPPLTAVSNLVLVTGASGSLFWLWVVALAGGQALFNRSLTISQRFAAGALAIGTCAVGWFAGRGWASGWMPPLVVALTLVWLRSWRMGLLISVLGALVVLIREPDLIPGLIRLDQYSIDTRLVAWAIVLGDVLPNNPILGLGPANYYFYTPLYPIVGYYISFNSHNQYVDILAQTGIIGLVVFAWLMLSIGKLGWNLRTRVDDGFARGYVYGCLAGLVGSLAAGVLGDWFLPFVYNIGLAGFRASMLGWLFLGGLVAIEQIANRKAQVAATE